MKRIPILLALLTTLFFGCNSKVKQSTKTETPVVLTPDEKEANLSTVPKGIRNSPLFSEAVIEPTQLFDNIYFVGFEGIGSFVITTSEGIILIDAMWTPENAENVIVPGIRKLGLDPKNIKYLIITHEHADHYGGASYFEDNYGVQILMSKVAWEGLHDPNAEILVDPYGNKSSSLPIPKNHEELKDKQQVILGDTAIDILLTPGHSEGAISMMIPTSDNGESHSAAIWGGTGLPKTLAANKNYLNSLNYFESVALEKNVDAQISNHPFSNGLLEKMKTLRTRKPGDPNPIVVTTTEFKAYIEDGLRKKVVEKIAGLSRE